MDLQFPPTRSPHQINHQLSSFGDGFLDNSLVACKLPDFKVEPFCLGTRSSYPFICYSFKFWIKKLICSDAYTFDLPTVNWHSWECFKWMLYTDILLIYFYVLLLKTCINSHFHTSSSLHNSMGIIQLCCCWAITTLLSPHFAAPKAICTQMLSDFCIVFQNNAFQNTKEPIIYHL